METSISYNNIQEVYTVPRWDTGQKYFLRIVVSDGSYLLQVSCFLFRIVVKGGEAEVGWFYNIDSFYITRVTSNLSFEKRAIFIRRMILVCWMLTVFLPLKSLFSTFVHLFRISSSIKMIIYPVSIRTRTREKDIRMGEGGGAGNKEIKMELRGSSGVGKNIGSRVEKIPD